VSAIWTEPEVAIVVPCYGYARFLGEAVQSAVAQTWRNLHIVVVDDGSPDETASVAERWIAEFPQRRITLLRQRNQGLAAARNAGIRATASEFVLPLDADDRLAPTAVERLVLALQRDGGDVATPLGRTFGDEDRELVTLPATKGRLRAGNCLVYASLFRRTLFDRIGGYRCGMRPAGYEDWDFWLGALERGARFVHVAEELFGYRKHGSSMLGAADRAALRLRAEIAVNHPALYSRWRVALARRALRGERAWWVRAGQLATLLLDRRLGLFLRQLRQPA
jgi:glycosyltransferase involved in cell wall biosynthesis